MIDAHDIRFSYDGPGGRRSLNGAQLHVSPGEVVAVLGHNGCGKSTLVKHFNALLPLQHGTLTIDGMDAADPANRWALRRKVGMVFQNPDNQFVSTIVGEDVAFGLEHYGVPENEIEFIHNADTEAKKAALFSKVRSGDVRVLLGSTAKMGAGTNVQSRLVAVHHLDVGWKPSDMTQRNGRIIRQGNMNKEVKVFNYVTEGTFDSYLFQTLENKQRFISQIMTSKSPVRSCEDVDEQALSYAEIKAQCARNPLNNEKMDLDVQVAKLKVLKADHQSQKFRLQDKLLTKFPADIQETNAHIAGLKADAQLAAAHPQGKEEFCGMTIRGVTYDEK